MFDETSLAMAQKTIAELARSNQMIVTAESCTGGLIAGALTEVPGSSEVVYGGFITYANAAKILMLGVPKTMLDRFGAVSKQVAKAMAQGALKASAVDIAIAVTGIAGPGGGTKEKPVGLIHFGCATKDITYWQERYFTDLGRQKIRLATVATALEMVLKILGNQP